MPRIVTDRTHEGNGQAGGELAALLRAHAGPVAIDERPGRLPAGRVGRDRQDSRDFPSL
jgi:hypothetical protein